MKKILLCFCAPLFAYTSDFRMDILQDIYEERHEVAIQKIYDLLEGTEDEAAQAALIAYYLNDLAENEEEKDFYKLVLECIISKEYDCDNEEIRQSNLIDSVDPYPT